jgi:serine/alanine adding enzyme
MRSGSTPPELNPDNPKYRAAISLWKKLPLNLTKLIGPSIIKNLP